HSLADEIVNLHAESVGDPGQNGKRRIARAALDLLQRVLMDARQLGHHAARQPFLLPDATYPRADRRRQPTPGSACHGCDSTLDCPLQRTLECPNRGQGRRRCRSRSVADGRYMWKCRCTSWRSWIGSQWTSDWSTARC